MAGVGAAFACRLPGWAHALFLFKFFHSPASRRFGTGFYKIRLN